MTKEDMVPNLTPEAPPAQPTPSGGRSRWLVIGLLVVGVALVVLFGLRTVRAYRHFHTVRRQPVGQNLSDLRPWMTIPDVAKTFDVPPEYLYVALGVQPINPDRRTLMDLNRTTAGGQRGAMEAKVSAAIEAFRSRKPPGPPHGGPPPDATAPPAPGDVAPVRTPSGGAP